MPDYSSNKKKEKRKTATPTMLKSLRYAGELSTHFGGLFLGL
jgi:hypothetical protein